MQQKNNNGVLFANEKRTSDKHPNYNGTAIVDGKPKSMSAWINKSKSGKSYMNIPRAIQEGSRSNPNIKCNF